MSHMKNIATTPLPTPHLALFHPTIPPHPPSSHTQKEKLKINHGFGLFIILLMSTTLLEYPLPPLPSPPPPNTNTQTNPGFGLFVEIHLVSLKFQTLISEIIQYFMLKKCVKLLQCKSISHFFNKNISGFGYKVIKHLTS